MAAPRAMVMEPHRQYTPRLRPQTMDSAVVPEEGGSKKAKRGEPDRCVVPITSQQQLDLVLDDARTHDNLVVFKYIRDKCPACAVVSVAFEKVCKKYSHYPYLRFHELNQDRNPELMSGGALPDSGVPQIPHAAAYLGRAGDRDQMDVAPPLNVRQLATEKVQRVVDTQRQAGKEVSQEQAQRLMAKELIAPATEAAEERLVELLGTFNRRHAKAYFENLPERPPPV
eukprot:TRINITY_DN5448_c0_g2_i1.p1 TRINITY_DN5448_c0_g2~~TRINITY_DN5448_c0_g2_i1.p1  ORF type:complete len:247 (+),score=79.28 TRINITY_DN5448_c0_g2_i1:62-742(+)